MLRRAGYSFGIAGVAAILGFTGALQGTALIARGFCFVFVGFSLLSLLLSLFEDSSQPATPEPVRLPQAQSSSPNNQGILASISRFLPRFKES
jgi:uncharacterized membrane protein YtjA (UPF0391 family)